MRVQRQISEIRTTQLTIELPESFVNHRAEIIVQTLDDNQPTQRQPHPDIAGKLVIKGSLLDSVPADDWDLPT